MSTGTMSTKRSLFTGKKLKLGVLGLSMAVLLAGCGAGTPKEEYAKAYEDLSKAKSYEVKSTIDFELDGEGLELDSEELELFNSMKMTVNAKSDVEKAQHEIDMNIGASLGAISINMDLPMYIDGNAQKVYTKADGMVSMLSGLTGIMGMPMSVELPDDAKGKVVDITGEDYSSEDVKAYTDSLTTKSEEFLNSISDEAFSKEGDVIIYKVKGDDMTEVFKDIIKANPAMGVTSDTMGGSSAGALDENTTFGDITVKTTVKKGTLEKEEIRIPMTIEDDLTGQKVSLTMTMVNEYTNIGKKLDFTFDLSEGNVMSETEFEELMTNAMFGSFEE